jgi:hypothetical protein
MANQIRTQKRSKGKLSRVMFFDALGRLPLGTAEWIDQTASASSQSATSVNACSRSIHGTGYCTSITLVLSTANNDSAEGVTLRLNSFDVMFEQNSGLM